MAFEWVLAGFSALTAALIGWQIFSLLSIRRAIREQIRRELPKIEGETLGTAYMSAAANYESLGNILKMVEYYTLAIGEFGKCDDKGKEIDECLGILRKTLSWEDHCPRRLTTSWDNCMRWITIVRSTKSEKSNEVEQWMRKVLAPSDPEISIIDNLTKLSTKP